MKTQNIALNKEISPIIDQVEKIKITNEATMGNAVSYLSKANQLLDRITEERERITKPLNEALKAERSRWKPLETILNEAISSIRGKMTSYQTLMIAQQKAEEQKIALKLSSGKITLDKAVAKIEAIEVPTNKVKTESGSISFKEQKVLKIVNATDIPREFLSINEKLLLEALKEGRKIPGATLEIIQVPVNYR